MEEQTDEAAKPIEKVQESFDNVKLEDTTAATDEKKDDVVAAKDEKKDEAAAAKDEKKDEEVAANDK